MTGGRSRGRRPRLLLHDHPNQQPYAHGHDGPGSDAPAYSWHIHRNTGAEGDSDRPRHWSHPAVGRLTLTSNVTSRRSPGPADRFSTVYLLCVHVPLSIGQYGHDDVARNSFFEADGTESGPDADQGPDPATLCLQLYEGLIRVTPAASASTSTPCPSTEWAETFPLG